MPNLIVSAVSTFDNKGLKKGTKEISAFEKRVKSFAKVFAAAFSVRALTNYSKKAVQAFMADEKAAKSLEQQLKNTGYQFSAPGIEQYISNLQKTTGVLDDEIRPAFQKLLSVTGSITLSQDALATALNTSAAGYGSSFPINRTLTTELLGFANLNYNVVYAQMGRGKAERVSRLLHRTGLHHCCHRYPAGRGVATGAGGANVLVVRGRYLGGTNFHQAHQSA